MNRRVCWYFLNGSCRYGQNCFYLHERPTVQVCKYFQKGNCWYGDRCRYLHFPRLDTGASDGRQSSAHEVHSSAQTDCRRSEASAVLAQDMLSWRQRPHSTRLQHSLHLVATDIREEEERTAAEAGPLPHPQGNERNLQACNTGPSDSCSHTSPESCCNDVLADLQRMHLQENAQRDAPDRGATASADWDQSEPYNQSKDVLCGICMDKVYEKPTARERRFAILPNCNHAFCIGCIMTWRKTKDFQEEVIKACPQCRVKSSFYVPSKYWVCEGEKKTALVASFKEKSSKIKCKFFMRYGCCPFESECIFSHELPPGHMPHRRIRRSIEEDLSEVLEDHTGVFYLAVLSLLCDESFDFDF